MAKDIFHNAVRVALEAEEWLITHDPFALKAGEINMEIDLAAEKMIAAEKDGQKIAVEIKSFLSKSKLQDFYLAKGQYDVYRKGLSKNEVDRKLYLAIEEEIYESFFQKALIREIISEENIFLIIFNSTTQTIVQWIE